MRTSATRGLLSLGLASGLLLIACGPENVVQFGSSGSGGGGGGSGGNGGSGSATCDFPAIDLLIAVDNSRGMAHKQEFLAQAIPDLVAGFVNPPCVDMNGNPSATQPSLPDVPCPSGTKRAFAAQTDIHIGVISSSIGAHGADACPDSDANSPQCSPLPNTTNNDRAHLLARKEPCNQNTVPTYANRGFLAWDPKQVLSPPGEDTLDDAMGGGLVPTLKEMVLGVSEIGCGYESQLESVYRFLSDPNPSATISVVNNVAVPMGTDTALLQQRAQFLRPDSLLVVLMTSDENDCSTKEFGQYFISNQLRTAGGMPFRMPRARKECAQNPNDECCKSCGQAPGNCPVDPSCVDAGGNTAVYSDVEDDINLRCWDQKRRFGIDFLYPIDRYTQAFTETMITDAAGNLVPNPIFLDLNPSDSHTEIRDPSLILVAGINGVPWQDIARDPKDVTKGFKTAQELKTPVGNASSAWDVILGDPANYLLPQDPLMVESVKPRSGQNPVTGTSLAPPQNPLGNPINGNEFTTTDELQYACIFPLPAPLQRDCTQPKWPACDCTDQPNDRPLCKAGPGGGDKTLQVGARATPSLRQLSLLKSLGSQSALGSVCAPQTDNPAAPDYGYKQSVKVVLDWLSRRGC